MTKILRVADYVTIAYFLVAAVWLAGTAHGQIVTEHGAGAFTTACVAAVVAGVVAGLAVHRWFASRTGTVCLLGAAFCVLEIVALVAGHFRLGVVLSGAVTGGVILFIWHSRAQKVAKAAREENNAFEMELVHRNRLRHIGEVDINVEEPVGDPAAAKEKLLDRHTGLAV